MLYLKGVHRHPEILAKVRSAVDHCDLRDVDIAGLDSFRKEFQAVCHLVESCGELAEARLAVLSPTLDSLKESGRLGESDAANLLSELDWLTQRLSKLQDSWSPKQLNLFEIAREPAQRFFDRFDPLIGGTDREILLEVFKEFLKLNKGQQFGSLDANKQIASAINDTMNQLGVRAKFTFRGEPVAAGYRCTKFGNSPPNGQFYFEFSINGKQEQQGHRAVLHDFELVAPTSRRSRSAPVEKTAKRAASRRPQS